MNEQVSENDVSEDKSTTDKVEGEEFAETYMERRLITANEAFKSEAQRIGLLQNGKLGVRLRGLGEDYILQFDIPSATRWDDSSLASFFREIQKTQQGPVIISNLEGQTLEIFFNSDMSAIGFEKDSYDFSISSVDETDAVFDESESLKSIGRRVSLLCEYSESDPTDCEGDGWRNKITNVSGIDKESFRIEVTTSQNQKFYWELNVPKSTEPSEDATAQLIEEIGYGDPRNLSGEEIVLVHKSDLGSLAEHVGTDGSGTWCLMTPNQFSEWGEEQKQKRKNALASATKEPRWKRQKAGAHALYAGGGCLLMRYLSFSDSPIFVLMEMVESFFELALVVSLLFIVGYTIEIHMYHYDESLDKARL